MLRIPLSCNSGKTDQWSWYRRASQVRRSLVRIVRERTARCTSASSNAGVRLSATVSRDKSLPMPKRRLRSGRAGRPPGGQDERAFRDEAHFPGFPAFIEVVASRALRLFPAKFPLRACFSGCIGPGRGPVNVPP